MQGHPTPRGGKRPAALLGRERSTRGLRPRVRAHARHDELLGIPQRHRETPADIEDPSAGPSARQQGAEIHPRAAG